MLADEFELVFQQMSDQHRQAVQIWTPIRTELYQWVLRQWLPYSQQQLFFGLDAAHLGAGSAFALCEALAERIRELELPQPVRMTDAEIFDACYREMIRRWGPAPYEP